MKNILRIMLLIGVFFISSTTFGQYLPTTYEAVLDEIVENFEEIRGKTSLNNGKSSLRLLSTEKIILRLDHKKSIKTLTFVKKNDEEGEKFWISDSKVTTDMINKYEKTVTKELNNMLKISRKQAKL